MRRFIIVCILWALCLPFCDLCVFTLSAQEAVNQTVTISNNGVTASFEMIYVKGGEFWMGATSNQAKDAMNDEVPSHRVAVADFYIGQTEVTQQLWFAVMGQSPQNDIEQWTSDFGLGDKYPAYYITWNAIQSFLKKLNELTGKNFRLPTEAEWEYAARGGAKSKGYKYSGSNKVKEVAWYWDNSQPTSHKVATKLANELGLYDMSGNVFEWCNDYHSETYYKESPKDNPKGPSRGDVRVLRGGSMNMPAAGCRVSFRFNNMPDEILYRNGFRIVCD